MQAQKRNVNTMLQYNIHKCCEAEESDLAKVPYSSTGMSLDVQFHSTGLLRSVVYLVGIVLGLVMGLHSLVLPHLLVLQYQQQHHLALLAFAVERCLPPAGPHTFAVLLVVPQVRRWISSRSRQLGSSPTWHGHQTVVWTPILRRLFCIGTFQAISSN